MGWYHSNRIGKGIFLGNKDCIKIDIEKLAKYLPDKDEEVMLINDISEDVLKTYEEWPLLWKFAAMDENQQYFWRNRLLEELAYDEAYILINTLHYCFEKKYNYPYNSFVSVSDYDGNVMFFCNIKWPPQEYRKELAELTEEKLKKQMQDFLSEVIDWESSESEMADMSFEVCVEYVKE